VAPAIQAAQGGALASSAGSGKHVPCAIRSALFALRTYLDKPRTTYMHTPYILPLSFIQAEPAVRHTSRSVARNNPLQLPCICVQSLRGNHAL
jgi:hypothetical protein